MHACIKTSSYKLDIFTPLRADHTTLSSVPSSWTPEQQLLPHTTPHLYSHPILSMSFCLLHKCRSVAFHLSLHWMFFMLLSWFVELRTPPVSWTLCQKPWPRYQQVFRN